MRNGRGDFLCLDREGEWGRRGEESGASVDLGSFTTGGTGRSLGGQMLYLPEGRDNELIH